MKKICYAVILVAAGCFLVGVTAEAASRAPAPAEPVKMTPPQADAADAMPPSNAPFLKGETIAYEVRNLALKIGQATLTFHGLTEIEGRKAVLIVFRATGLNFLDEERIFADPVSFHPIFVTRDLNIWGKKEKIDEYYEPERGRLRIVKKRGGQTEEQIFKKDGLLDNIYCFIYRNRMAGDFSEGKTLTMRLPTTDVQMAFKKKTSLKTAEGRFEAYYLESRPSKYKVWFDAGNKKIPLKINGSLGLGAMSMSMVKYYSQGKDQK